MRLLISLISDHFLLIMAKPTAKILATIKHIPPILVTNAREKPSTNNKLPKNDPSPKEMIPIDCKILTKFSCSIL